MASIDELIKTLEQEYGQKLTITSTKRSIAQQASGMLNAFRGNYTTHYDIKKQDLYAEIKKAYELHKEETDPLVKQALVNVITKQVERDRYISWHFLDSARDIRTRDLDDNGAELVTIILNHPELQLVDERTNPKEPHIHIHMKQ